MRRPSIEAAVSLACLLALSACRAREADPSRSDAAAEAPFSGLTLDLTPDPARQEIDVAVRVRGDSAASVREIAVARAWADTRGAEALSGVRLRDGDGDVALKLRPDDGGPDDVYTLPRAPRGGDLLLRYRARANVGRSRFSLRVAGDRLSGVGHAFLLLPRLDAPVPARIRVHLGALRRGADAASSFGFGAEVVTTATSEDLAHAAYVAGMLWQERDAGEQAALVVLGDPPFDTRTALDHTLAARAAIERFFADPAAPPSAPPVTPAPFTILLVAQPGLGRAREGASLTRSLGVFFDARQPFDAALDLVIAHELLHRFLGGTVRLAGRDGREAAWFSEGFTVHFARRILLDAGLLAPEGFADDVNRTLGDGDERLPSAYVHGALAAAWLDAALRRASHGRRSLDDVVRDLVAEARATGNETLPLASLRDTLARAIGPEAAALVDRLDAGDDAPIDLPDDAFGPCARRVVRERATFDLGFDPASLDARPTLVRGLVKGSAAERAGVREGALVLTAKVPPRASRERRALREPRDDAEVELWLADGKRVRYRAAGTKREAIWEPAACARAAERPAAITAPGR